LALEGQHDATCACPRDPSLLQPSEPLQDQICQQDDDDRISRNWSKELTCPVLNASEEDNEGQKPEKHEEEVEVEQEEQDSNISNNSKIDDGNSAVDISKNSSDQAIDQDSNESESPRFAKQCRPPPSRRDTTLSSYRKRRRQCSDERLPTLPSRQQQPQEVEEREEEQWEVQTSNSSGSGDSNDEDDDDYNDGQVSDDSEDPRPAKRRRPSRSDNDCVSKRGRKVRFQLSHDGYLRNPSDLDRSRTASIPTRLQRSSSSRYDNQQESRIRAECETEKEKA
jgi:hypothetical protein